MMTRTQMEWYANNLWRTSENFSKDETIGARILAWQASGDTVEVVVSKLEKWAEDVPAYKAHIEVALKAIRRDY